MKADLSRLTFDPAKHRSGVVMQQGRVQLDADWNEQRAIQQYRDETVAGDLIGPSGVPKPVAGGGFAIGVTADDADLTIGNGRFYVDGILCEATPTEVPARVDSATQVTVAARRVDGREFAVGQWVELLPSSPVARRRITAVGQPVPTNPSRQLTLDAALPAFPVNAAVRVRRVFTYTTQPDSFRPLPGQAGRYRVDLDVWQRHITEIEDPSIREIALGGPDTATRLQTVWQVKLERIGNQGAGGCDTVLAAPPGKGRLRARIKPAAGGTGDGPCVLPPTEGFQGLENQLYRVEVHRGGSAGDGQARFKWQRDNGSIVTAFEQFAPDLIVRDLGRDDVLGFQTNNRVEVTDDRRELDGQPGDLTTLTVLDRATRKIQLGGGVAPPQDQTIHPRLRRWDNDALIPGSQTTWIDLEHGLQVQFEAGRYEPGDYWLIPARTATTGVTGDIEWPRDDAGDALWQPAHGIEHHTAPLAVVDFDGAKFLKVPGTNLLDCRRPFPSLTTIEAGDVAFDDASCQLGAATTVQGAIDALCARNGDVCTHVVTPGAGWEAVFGQVAAGEDARICFPVGAYPVSQPIQVLGKGNLTLTGAGPGTRLSTAGAESVLRFDSCASVYVRDVSVASGVAATPAERASRHGALHFANCGEVTVESVHLQTAPLPAPEATCLTIEARVLPSGIMARVSARVRHCQLDIGEYQVGVLLLNVARAQVEDNVLRVRTGRFSTRVEDWLASGPARARMLDALIGRASLGQAPPGGGTNVALQWGQGVVHFATPQPLVSFWTDVLNTEQPARISSAKVLLDYLKRTTDHLLRGQGPANLVSRLRQWATAEVAAFPAVAAQGIVVGGRQATEVRVRDNTIEGVVQGVHVGLSQGGSVATRLPAGRVLVADNTVGVVLPRHGLRERHGIFLGSCDSAVIERNHVTVDRSARPPGPKTPIDGVRVVGVLGRRVIVRENHLEGCTTGVLFHPLNPPVSPGPSPLPIPAMQWLVADNAMPSAAVLGWLKPPELPEPPPQVRARIKETNNVA